MTTKTIEKGVIPIANLSVWGGCAIQVITDENRWLTVGQCLWTPNAIAEEVTKIRRKGDTRRLWIKDPTGDRKMLD